MQPDTYTLSDALFAPLLLSGASTKALRALHAELSVRVPETPLAAYDVSVEAAHAAVDTLGHKAGFDARPTTASATGPLPHPDRFADDLDNAVEHGLALGRAWLDAHGRPPLTPEVEGWLRKRMHDMGVDAAQGWAEHLLETHAHVLRIEGHYGPRTLGLVRGGVDAHRADAWVVSGPPRDPDDGSDLFSGGAFSAISERFGAIDRAHWTQLLRFTPGTPFWPRGAPTLDAAHDAYLARCGVWHVPGPWKDKPQPPCKHLIALRNVPTDMFRPRGGRKAAGNVIGVRAVDALRCWLDALFAALAVIGSQGDPANAPRTVRMTLLLRRQIRTPEASLALLDTLVTHSLERLRASPVVERLDIAFYTSEEQEWLATNWKSYLHAVEGAAPAEDDEVARLLRSRCLTEAERLRRDRSQDTLLARALDELVECLHTAPAPRPTHLGFAARHAVEAIVASLCRRHGRKESATLEANIDELQRHGRYARWFVSYLHTLRILGNECVHASTREVLPRAMESADQAVLLASLARVLTVSRTALPR